MSPDSLFSFMKPQNEPEKPAAPPPPQAQPAPPPAAPAFQVPPPPPVGASPEFKKISERVAVIEDRLKAFEGAAARLDELEARVKAMEEAAPGTEARLASAEKAEKEAARLNGEFSVMRSRMEGLEETCRVLGMSSNESKRYIKELEASVLGEIKRRLEAFDSAFNEITRRASLAHDTAVNAEKRLDRVEESSLRVTHLESRLEASEKKLEPFYELDAAVQALKASMDSVEGRLAALTRDSAALSGRQESAASDIGSLAHELKQLSALFNYFRTELSFLLPGRKEPAGGER